MKATIQTTSIKMFFGLFVITMMACSSGNSPDNTAIDHETPKGAVIEFDKEVHDFGQIVSGERVSYAFRFTNKGTEPLLITGIKSGCGCTVGEYPREPILPKKSGRVQVVFNSSGRRGFQAEIVRVFTNAGEQVITLRIQGEVLERI
jgi:hypothetical protein